MRNTTATATVTTATETRTVIVATGASTAARRLPAAFARLALTPGAVCRVTYPTRGTRTFRVRQYGTSTFYMRTAGV